MESFFLHKKSDDDKLKLREKVNYYDWRTSMDLNSMSITAKINCLEDCLNRASEDIELKNSTFGKNLEAVKGEIQIIITNGRTLFSGDRLDALDYDVKREAMIKWHSILNAILKKFPEFQIENNEAIGMGK